MRSLIPFVVVTLFLLGDTATAASTPTLRKAKLTKSDLPVRQTATPAPHLKKTGAFSCPEADHFNEQMGAIVAEIPMRMSQVLDGSNNGQPTVMNAECLHLNGGWWKYEFCWDRWIRQLHEERGVVLAEYFLGLGKDARKRDVLSSRPVPYSDGHNSMADKILEEKRVVPTGQNARFWCAAELTSAVRQHYTAFRTNGMPQKWVSVDEKELVPAAVKTEFLGGTKCDVTGEARSAEILAICDPVGVFGGPTHLEMQPMISFNISEVSPCRYQVLLGGPAICKAMSKGYSGGQEQQQPKPKQQAPPQSQQAGGQDQTVSPPSAEQQQEVTPKSKVRRLLEERSKRLADAAKKYRERKQDIQEKIQDLKNQQDQEEREYAQVASGASRAKEEQRLGPSSGRNKPQQEANHQQPQQQGQQQQGGGESSIGTDNSGQKPQADAAAAHGGPQEGHEAEVNVPKFSLDTEAEPTKQEKMTPEQEEVFHAILRAKKAGNQEEEEMLQEKLTKMIFEHLAQNGFQLDQHELTTASFSPEGGITPGIATLQRFPKTDAGDSAALDKASLAGGIEDGEDDTLVFTL